MPEALIQCLAECAALRGHPEPVTIAYSGGLDSTALLYASVEYLGPARVGALHINHRLSVYADDWARHCREVCQGLGIKLEVAEVEVSESGTSLETAARHARYRVFEQRLQTGGLLLLAHHRDDQAETVFYRLLRGSGPRGLAGIPVSRPLGQGLLLRPFLNLERDTLESFVQGRGLAWIEDDSNAELHHDRNYLRQQVSPKLRVRWPDFSARVAASAAWCADAQLLLEQLGELDLRALDVRAERVGWSIDLNGFSNLPTQRQSNLLRVWVGQHHALPPGHRVIASVQQSLIGASDDAKPLVHWEGGEWRRYARRLYLLPGGAGPDPEPGQEFQWRPEAGALQFDGGCLEAATVRGRGLRVSGDGSLMVKFRRGGERCRPIGRRGSAKLKQLFQEHQLEPWLRGRVPLIYNAQGELLAVGDLWVCVGHGVKDDEPGWVLSWRPMMERVVATGVEPEG